MVITMQKIKDANYVYASARIRSAEGNWTEKERFEKLLDAKNSAAVSALIVDCGLVPPGADAGASVTELLNMALNHAVRLVREAAPDPDIYDFLLYKYDCNNLKTEIKSLFTGIDAGGLLFSCGSEPPESAAYSVKERNFSCFPHHMARAAAEAIDAYEQTGDAKSIDFLLDGACFSDVAEGAALSDVPFFTEYVEAVADVTNLRSAARIFSSGAQAAAAESLLKKVFVAGGKIKLSALSLSDANFGPSVFSAIAERMDPSPLKNITSEATSFEDAEKAYGEYLRSMIAPFAYKSFGPEIPACFLISREEEIKRFRKAAALISAGTVGKEKLRERIGTFV